MIYLGGHWENTKDGVAFVRYYRHPEPEDLDDLRGQEIIKPTIF